jgi:ankyrin repeat protein
MTDVGAGQGHLDVVRVLLKLRADIDVADDDGETPLMAASVHEHYEIVKWVVKAGADTQIKVGVDTQIAEGTSTAAKLSREVGASPTLEKRT